jgi:hypothetical protein
VSKSVLRLVLKYLEATFIIIISKRMHRGLRGHLITNFPQSMRLVCKYMVAEGIARGVLPVLNAV